MSDHGVYCCIDPGVRDEPHPDCPGFWELARSRTYTIRIPVAKERAMTQYVTNLVRLAVQLGVGYIIALAASLGIPAVSPSVRDAIIAAITGVAMAALNPVLNWLSQHFPFLGVLKVAKVSRAPSSPATR